jgi:hypothetical protein
MGSAKRSATLLSAGPMPSRRHSIWRAGDSLWDVRTLGRAHRRATRQTTFANESRTVASCSSATVSMTCCNVAGVPLREDCDARAVLGLGCEVAVGACNQRRPPARPAISFSVAGHYSAGALSHAGAACAQVPSSLCCAAGAHRAFDFPRCAPLLREPARVERRSKSRRSSLR